MFINFTLASLEATLKSYLKSQEIYDIPTIRDIITSSTVDNQYISLHASSPHLPSKWSELLKNSKVPETNQQDFYYYLLQTKQALIFDEDKLISSDAVNQAIKTLKQ